MEKLLREEEKRYTLFPIKYNDLWQLYKDQETSFWRIEEVDLSEDKWDSLNENEQHFIKNTLAFFAASDGIVSENLAQNFLNEVKITEAQFYYAFQMMMENIHSQAYSHMIDTYIKDINERDKLFDAINQIPSVKKKADWAIKWINSDNFIERLVAFICVEGIFFSSSFASIFWLREQKKLPGLCKYNTWISRDEGHHQKFATYLYNNYVENKLSDARINEIISEAVAIEKEFVTESLPVRLIGINSDMMCNYIDFVASSIYQDLGINVTSVNNPFKFMEKILAERKVNFFEGKVAEYRKADLNNITLNDEDF